MQTSLLCSTSFPSLSMEWFLEMIKFFLRIQQSRVEKKYLNMIQIDFLAVALFIDSTLLCVGIHYFFCEMPRMSMISRKYCGGKEERFCGFLLSSCVGVLCFLLSCVSMSFLLNFKRCSLDCGRKSSSINFMTHLQREIYSILRQRRTWCLPVSLISDLGCCHVN